MKLTLKDVVHIDDAIWPLQPPMMLVTGDRATLWAEDEHGNIWLKHRDESRWIRTTHFSTVPKP